MKAEQSYLAIETRLYEDIMRTFTVRKIDPAVGYLILKSITGRIADEALRVEVANEVELEKRLQDVVSDYSKKKQERKPEQPKVEVIKDDGTEKV